MRALVVIAVAGSLAGSASAAAPFTPKTLAGTWHGSWENDTFVTAGPAKLVAKSLDGNRKLLFSIDFGGRVFGCKSVPPEATRPLTRGVGANRWNANGFVIQGSSKDFGKLKLTYKASSGKLTGSGVNPPCAGGLSWSLTGEFFGPNFIGKINITLPDKSKAFSNLTLQHD